MKTDPHIKETFSVPASLAAHVRALAKEDMRPFSHQVVYLLVKGLQAEGKPWTKPENVDA